MRQFLFIISIILIPFSAISQQTELEPSKQIKFTEQKWDFGKIKEVDRIVSHTFEFRNISDKPFVINYVSVSCGCTTPEYSKEPIIPGKTGKIKVNYDPKDRPGYFNKDIFVMSGNRESQDVLNIYGEVTGRPRTIEEDFPYPLSSGVRVSNLKSDLGQIQLEPRFTHVINVYNSSSDNITIKGVSLDNTVGIKIPQPVIKSKEKVQIMATVDLTNAKPDMIRKSFSIVVDGKESHQFEITAIITPNFEALTPEEMASAPKSYFSAQYYSFSAIKDGKKVSRDFRITNKGTKDLIIENIIPSSDKIEYSIPSKTIAPGENQVITLYLTPKGVNGRISERVTIIMNDPITPVREIRLTANVE